MHLVKWIRKNMSKLMAVFVIVIMIAFIMPSLLNQLSKPRTTGRSSDMWTYDNDKKITVDELRQASNELSVLRGLMADRFLLGMQDMRLMFLSQLLFPESQEGAIVSDELKNLVMQNRIAISPSQIDNFYRQSRGRSELFFVLLRNEAKNAGCAISPENAAAVLNSVIPQLTQNQIDSATLVKNIGASNGMSDDQVLNTFADIMSIIVYSKIVTDTENVTEAQIENAYARLVEKINVEFVEFSNDEFKKKASQPSNEQIAKQFEKYKNILPGTASAENPCGFGYKLPARVAMDYMIIKLEDLRKKVTPPTEEEAEEYYRQNLERAPITVEVPGDSNDPNAKPVKKQRSYAEVDDTIKKVLLARKVNALATQILSKAVEQADGGFESLDLEKTSLETLKSKAGDYSVVAQNVSKEFDVQIYTGRTSLLTAEDLHSDKYFGGLMMMGRSRMPTQLAKLVFAVKQLGDEATLPGPFEPSVPKMFTSAGPFLDMGNEFTAIVRVVDVAGSQTADGIDFSYQKNLPDIDKTAPAKSKQFVLKDNIADDCKKLQAAELAGQAANKFLELAQKQSWDVAIDKLNVDYGTKDVNDPNAKTFAVRNMTNLKRISQKDIELTRMRVSSMMGAETIMTQSKRYAALIDAFYNKYNQLQTSGEKLPLVINFEQGLSSYVIKNLIVENPGTVEEFEKVRPQLAMQQEFLDSQSASVDFFMPDNITARLKVKAVEQSNQSSDTNDANDANGAKK